MANPLFLGNILMSLLLFWSTVYVALSAAPLPLDGEQQTSSSAYTAGDVLKFDEAANEGGSALRVTEMLMASNAAESYTHLHPVGLDFEAGEVCCQRFPNTRRVTSHLPHQTQERVIECACASLPNHPRAAE